MLTTFLLSTQARSREQDYHYHQAWDQDIHFREAGLHHHSCLRRWRLRWLVKSGKGKKTADLFFFLLECFLRREEWDENFWLPDARTRSFICLMNLALMILLLLFFSLILTFFDSFLDGFW